MVGWAKAMNTITACDTMSSFTYTVHRSSLRYCTRIQCPSLNTTPTTTIWTCIHELLQWLWKGRSTHNCWSYDICHIINGYELATCWLNVYERGRSNHSHWHCDLCGTLQWLNHNQWSYADHPRFSLKLVLTWPIILHYYCGPPPKYLAGFDPTTSVWKQVLQGLSYQASNVGSNSATE